MLMKILNSVLVFSFLMIIVSSTVLAGQPNNRACLGKDFSGYAENGVGFGSFVSNLAMTTNGIGEEIQAHLAGLVPDEVIPNSCNN